MIYNFLKIIIKKPIHYIERIANYVIFLIYKIEVETFPDIRGIIFIRNHGVIKIGKGVVINCKKSANPVGGPYSTSLAVSSGARLILGENVGISGTAIMCNKEIIIEDDVLIGSGCCIYDTDFHSIDYKKRKLSTDNDVTEKPVRIRQGAFIGARTIVLKGVTIGKHSVVGAGSVVTKDIPDDEIWAGNPAKRIGSIT